MKKDACMFIECLNFLFNNFFSIGFFFRGYGKLGTGDLQVMRSVPVMFFKNKLIMSIAVALRPKVVPIFHSTALEGKLVNVCHYKLILFPLVSFFVYTNGAFLTSSKQNFVYFFRETALLVDPENSSSAAKQWVALVVGESDFFKFNHL